MLAPTMTPLAARRIPRVLLNRFRKRPRIVPPIGPTFLAQWPIKSTHRHYSATVNSLQHSLPETAYSLPEYVSFQVSTLDRQKLKAGDLIELSKSTQPVIHFARPDGSWSENTWLPDPILREEGPDTCRGFFYLHRESPRPHVAAGSIRFRLLPEGAAFSKAVQRDPVEAAFRHGVDLITNDDGFTPWGKQLWRYWASRHVRQRIRDDALITESEDTIIRCLWVNGFFASTSYTRFFDQGERNFNEFPGASTEYPQCSHSISESFVLDLSRNYYSFRVPDDDGVARIFLPSIRETSKKAEGPYSGVGLVRLELAVVKDPEDRVLRGRMANEPSLVIRLLKLLRPPNPGDRFHQCEGELLKLYDTSRKAERIYTAVPQDLLPQASLQALKAKYLPKRVRLPAAYTAPPPNTISTLSRSDITHTDYVDFRGEMASRVFFKNLRNPDGSPMVCAMEYGAVPFKTEWPDDAWGFLYFHRPWPCTHVALGEIRFRQARRPRDSRQDAQDAFASGEDLCAPGSMLPWSMRLLALHVANPYMRPAYLQLQQDGLVSATGDRAIARLLPPESSPSRVYPRRLGVDANFNIPSVAEKIEGSFTIRLPLKLFSMMVLEDEGVFMIMAHPRISRTAVTNRCDILAEVRFEAVRTVVMTTKGPPRDPILQIQIALRVVSLWPKFDNLEHVALHAQREGELLRWWKSKEEASNFDAGNYVLIDPKHFPEASIRRLVERDLGGFEGGTL